MQNYVTFLRIISNEYAVAGRGDVKKGCKEVAAKSHSLKRRWLQELVMKKEVVANLYKLFSR